MSGRIGHDLAPAGMQTYFNPLLDVPGYWMGEHLPPKLGGFLLGAFHGLAVLLLYSIARSVLPEATSARAAMWLAAAGGLSGTFVSELGNSMGDNTTSVLVLCSVALVLATLRGRTSNRPPPRFDLAPCAVAGLIVGMAAGLKLTNAPFALALVGAMAWTPGPWRDKLVLMVAIALSAGVGIAVTGGHWYVTMWNQFGNPLFPQFNNVFKSELAAAVGVVDTRWRPHGLAQAMLFPYVFTIQPNRVGELSIVQLLWPVAYTLVLLYAARGIWASWKAHVPKHEDTSGADTRFVFLLAFLSVSYLAWLTVFSIGRYTVVIEALLPLVTWLLLHRFLPARIATMIGMILLSTAVVVTLLRMETWGYARWSERRYSVDVPEALLTKPGPVAFLGGAHAWMIPDLPQAPAYVSLGYFPESDGYRRRAKEILQAGSQRYAIVNGAVDAQANALRELNQWITEKGIQRDTFACRVIHRVGSLNPRFRKTEPEPAGAGGEALCTYRLPKKFRKDLVAENLQLARDGEKLARHYGLRLDLSTCAAYRARMGAKEMSYQLCPMDWAP